MSEADHSFPFFCCRSEKPCLVGLPGSGEHAGLIVVGTEEAQQAAPEVPKLLLAVLPHNALPNGLQGHIPRHARHHFLHPACENVLQCCQPLTLHMFHQALPCPRLCRLPSNPAYHEEQQQCKTTITKSTPCIQPEKSTAVLPDSRTACETIDFSTSTP